MAAQRGQAFQRVEEGEESAKIAQEAAANGQNEDTARWATVERRLDQEARARMESEARMALPIMLEHLLFVLDTNLLGQ